MEKLVPPPPVNVLGRVDVICPTFCRNLKCQYFKHTVKIHSCCCDFCFGEPERKIERNHPTNSSNASNLTKNSPTFEIWKAWPICCGSAMIVWVGCSCWRVYSAKLNNMASVGHFISYNGTQGFQQSVHLHQSTKQPQLKVLSMILSQN